MAHVTLSELCLVCRETIDGKYAIYMHVVELDRNSGSYRWSNVKQGRAKLNYTMKKPRGLIHIDCVLSSSLFEGVKPD